MLNHIKQFTDIDCGFAAAAMLAGVEYLDAIDLDPAPDQDRGLRVEEMATLLESLTGQEWKVSKKHYQKPLSEIGLHGVVKDAPIALLLRRPDVSFGHWVACERGRIYDPEMDAPLSLELYPRASWRIIRIIYPPEEKALTYGLFS